MSCLRICAALLAAFLDLDLQCGILAEPKGKVDLRKDEHMVSYSPETLCPS